MDRCRRLTNALCASALLACPLFSHAEDFSPIPEVYDVWQPPAPWLYTPPPEQWQPQSVPESVVPAKARKSLSGSASYYGRRFHGRKTASGQRFDMNAMTAAHRTLPLGSVVKVTNTRNSRSVVLRINDRGPYHGRRVLDVSKGAAEALGMLNSGTAPVRIEVLSQPQQIARED
jgi:rare lipoprotein A